MVTLTVAGPDDGRITQSAEYGEHIPLTCKNHPELRWSTKNIGGRASDGRIFFGRSVFFPSSNWREGHEECDCPGSDLRCLEDL